MELDLVGMYERLGYKVVARIPFTDKYIEKHDDGTAVNPEEQILLDERPDVYVLMTNGDDFATATQKIKNVKDNYEGSKGDEKTTQKAGQSVQENTNKGSKRDYGNKQETEDMCNLRAWIYVL